MQYIPPELRKASTKSNSRSNMGLPALVETSDVRGDFHMHSTWSDGDDSLEEMIAAAAARGYEYHSISDHSHGRRLVSFGLSIEKSARAARRSRSVRRHATSIRTLCSSEVDILARRFDGLPDEVLAQFDFAFGVGAFGVPTDSRRDDRTFDSRLRESIRQHHRPPDRAALDSYQATSSITTRCSQRPREPERRWKSTGRSHAPRSAVALSASAQVVSA